MCAVSHAEHGILGVSATELIGHRGSASVGAAAKYRRWNPIATLTKAIITGTSTSGPMIAANAAPELIPNTATATAIANSKLLANCSEGQCRGLSYPLRSDDP